MSTVQVPTAKDTEVLTREVRFSYPKVWEPGSFGTNSKKKYSVSLLIPKSDTVGVAMIQKAIAAAIAIGKADIFKGKTPKTEKIAWRDGDTDETKSDDENYKGHFFLSANSDFKPAIIDKQNKEILIQSDFYAGCYGRALINFYPYVFEGVLGVACGLLAVQKLRDGEAFSARPSDAESISKFTPVADAADDLM